MLGQPQRTMFAGGDVEFTFVGLLLHCDGADGSTIFTDVKGHTVTAVHSTKLLLHCDGSDGSTTFTDSMGHTVTANGNVQIDTAQSKFGGASALFDGTGDYLSVPTSTDFTFGTGDFTVECWAYCTNTTPQQALISLRDALNSKSDNVLALNFGDAGKLCWSDGTSWHSASSAFPANQWVHVALVRSGSTVTIYQDGVNVKSLTTSLNITGSRPCYIGTFDTFPAYYNGWIDEVRITKGIARYTANFTPPTAAFPDY